MKKYELTSETKIVGGKKLFRIKALINFNDVFIGDLGGFIEKEENLSHEGYAWVYGDACVYENARVCGDARIHNNARVYGKARVCNNAKVYDNAYVYGNARIYGNAYVYDNAVVCNNVDVYGNASICGDAFVYDNARVCNNAEVYGNASIYGDAEVCDKSCVCGDAEVYGNASICGDAMIKNITDIITISPIGSRNDTTTFFKNKDGAINVTCGCFKGSIDEFVNAVKETHHGTIYEKQYNLAIEMAKTIIRS